MARILPDDDLEVVADAVDCSLYQYKHTHATNMCVLKTDINALQKIKPLYEERLSSLETKVEQYKDMSKYFEQQFQLLKAPTH